MTNCCGKEVDEASKRLKLLLLWILIWNGNCVVCLELEKNKLRFGKNEEI